MYNWWAFYDEEASARANTMYCYLGEYKNYKEAKEEAERRNLPPVYLYRERIPCGCVEVVSA